MGNLVEDLGAGYAQDALMGAWFRVGEDLTGFRRMSTENKWQAHKLVKKDGVVQAISTYYPISLLKDFSILEYPKLGYRNCVASGCKAVVRVGMRRSTNRGMRPELLLTELLSSDFVLNHGFNPWMEMRGTDQIWEIFNPTFIPYTEGIKKLLAGDIASFAVSHDLAVCLSLTRSADSTYDIHFRGRVVGSVDEAGNISLTNKILKRSAIHNQLFK